MKSLFAVPFLAFFCIAAGFDYQPFGCPKDVSDYIIQKEIKRDCQPGRKPTDWKAYVDCVTKNGANLAKAVEHCQEGDHVNQHAANPNDYFEKVCPAEPNQEQFHYHCCFQTHALGFSTNMTWDQYITIQDNCAKDNLK